jgi:cysteine desulfurase / selenocysteine lyase
MKISNKIRNDFPTLDLKINGHRYAFLDSAASSLKPKQVVQALSDVLLGKYANIHRGVYQASMETTDKFEAARQKISAFFGANSKSDVLVFTRGATDAINAIAQGILSSQLKQGDKILLTAMEHHANIVPWQEVAKRTGAQLVYIKPTAQGTLDLKEYGKLCQTHQPKIVTFTYVSNVLGTINPIKEMTKIAKQVGATVLIDAAQAPLHLPLKFNETGSDFMVVSAHKMLGPTGIGCFLAKRNLMESAEPYQFGGDMILSVDFETSTWNEVPQKFEAGTPAIAEAIAWATACDYLGDIGWENIHQHEQELLAHTMEILISNPRIKIFGPQDLNQRSGVISFSIEGAHPHDIATILDNEGIAVRAGHHCAQVLMKLLEVQATTRVSFGIYNTHEDVLQFERGLKKVFEVFKK